MLAYTTTLRVRYGETDTMGVAYYGNYPLYYEVGRTELMRSLGLPYSELEKRGIILPVIHLECKYLAPAKYDQLLTIRTSINEPPTVKIRFDYEIFADEKLINRGFTVLAFTDAKKQRPIHPPQEIIKLWEDNSLSTSK